MFCFIKYYQTKKDQKSIITRQQKNTTMKNLIQKLQKTLINSRLFLGATLMIALMIPSTTMAQSSPAAVNLRTSGNFVVLAKTGISTTGTTSIVGDIGLSPSAATAITGFNLTADASDEFATSPLINGKVYAANYTSPTPTKLTTAVSDMQTAYTDAAGRSADFNEEYSGDITGQTLTTGVYKWGTDVLVSSAGVTISGSSTDVWIFIIAQNLTVANGAIIHLSGGAEASNIFWQVAGEATIGTTADFSGIILCKTKIDMQTGAAFSGRALSQTAVTLDANRVSSSTILGINNLTLQNDIGMYPNPGNNTLTVANSTNIKLDQLAIYDASGRQVNMIDLRGMQQEKSIDMSKLPPGVYMLQIQSDGAQTIKRWIKQ